MTPRMGDASMTAATDNEKPDEPRRIPPDEANRGRRGCGCVLLVAMLLGTPILLLVALYFGVWWTGGRMVAEALEKARAAGDPTTVEEMNAFYPTSPEIEEATGHWLRAIAFVEHPDFNKEATGVPILGQPQLAYDDRGLLAPRQIELSAPFVDKWREVVVEARAAREAGAVARFPTKFEDGIAMLLSHVQGMRAICNLLRLDLEIRLARGELDAAVDDLLSMIAASESLANEPLLISQLVRIAILGVAVQSTREAIDRVEFSDERLARLQEAFARVDLAPGMQRWARGEQFWMLATIQGEMPSGDLAVDRLRMLPTNGADVAKTMELWRPVIDAGDEGMLAMDEAMRNMEVEIEKLAASNVARVQYPVTLMFLPAIQAGSNATMRGQANARLATAGVACERYRLANGEWPARLDDLAPRFLPAAPLDPLDDRPLRYIVEADGILLYSLGDDRVDDGGVDDPMNGDVVFRLKDRVKNEEAP